jgi:hypothetical protein
MSNLAEQISEALSMFARIGTEPALIGAPKIHRATLNMDELQAYFVLFNKPDLLHELLG